MQILPIIGKPVSGRFKIRCWGRGGAKILFCMQYIGAKKSAVKVFFTFFQLPGSGAGDVRLFADEKSLILLF